ncbi:MAG TPA: PQQ-binding-like beta-propeller repeat protein, partial [Verrucomicrobiae bacterium]|nr:PQQ-binding-like beta-propeller repeat protein [Verrucomicrobiae bacterium]
GAGSLELSIAGLYSEGVFYDSLLYSNRFAAFDAASGRVLWRTPTTGRVKMSAVLKDGLVYFGDTAGYFYVVRATDGAILAKTKFPEIFTTSPPVIVGDRLFVANSSTLYALRLEDLRRGVISAP